MRNKISIPKSQIPNPKVGVARFAFGMSLLLGAWNLELSAADWPQWGGNSIRNMYSPAKGLPDSFGQIEYKPGTEEVDTKGVKNLRLATKIGSQSYGNV